MTTQLKQHLIEEYKKASYNTFEAGGGHGFRYYHGVRVMTYCEKFLELPYFKDKKVNKDAAIIAALFADIGKVAALNEQGELIYGSQGDLDHAEIGARIIREYLEKHIKDVKLIDFIAQIIDEQHGKEQTSLEAQLVKDADRLDNYGFIQIWRHITFAHYDKRNIDRLNEFWVQEAAREKAKGYLEKFHFPFVKKIAMQRFEKLDYFLHEIEREVKGENIEPTRSSMEH